MLYNTNNKKRTLVSPLAWFVHLMRRMKIAIFICYPSMASREIIMANRVSNATESDESFGEIFFPARFKYFFICISSFHEELAQIGADKGRMN